MILFADSTWQIPSVVASDVADRFHGRVSHIGIRNLQENRVA